LPQLEPAVEAACARGGASHARASAPSRPRPQRRREEWRSLAPTPEKGHRARDERGGDARARGGGRRPGEESSAVGGPPATAATVGAAKAAGQREIWSYTQIRSLQVGLRSLQT
jgi:hypothetical protein